MTVEAELAEVTVGSSDTAARAAVSLDDAGYPSFEHQEPDIVVDYEAIAQERALTLIEPLPAKVVRMRLSGLPQDAIGIELGLRRKKVSVLLKRGNEQLAGVMPTVADGTFDYAAWGDHSRSYVGRQTPLVYLAKVGVNIPKATSLEVLRDLARAHVDSVAELAKKDKELVIGMYQLDESSQMTLDDLATEYGVTRQVVPRKVNDALEILSDTVILRERVPLSTESRLGADLPEGACGVFAIGEALGISGNVMLEELSRYDLLGHARTDRLDDGRVVTWLDSSTVAQVVARASDWRIGDAVKGKPVNQDDIIRERSFMLMDPTAASVVQIATTYPELTQKHVAPLMKLSASGFKASLRRGTAQLNEYAERLVLGNFDYVAWSEEGAPESWKQNPLVYLAKVGMDIPDTATLSELAQLATDHLDAAISINERDKRVVADYHSFGGPKATTELMAKSYGLSYHGIKLIIQRSMARLAPNVRDSNLPEDTELLATDVAATLAAIRLTYDQLRIRPDGRNTSVHTYAGKIQAMILELDSADMLVKKLGDNFEPSVASAVKAIVRYREQAGTPLEAYVADDLAVIAQYLEDVSKLSGMGIEKGRAIGVANYLSPQGLRSLQKQYGHINTRAINTLVGRSPYLREVTIERYEECLQQLRNQYAEHEDVADFVLEAVALKFPNATPDRAVEAVVEWIETYYELKERYRANRTIPDEVVKEVALRWPNHPDLGLKVIGYRYRRKTMSNDATTSGGTNSIGDVSVNRSLDNYVDNPEQLYVDRESGRQAYNQLAELMGDLSPEESLLVMHLYGLPVYAPEQADHDELVRQDLLRLAKFFKLSDAEALMMYAQSDILPKLREKSQGA